MSTYYYFEYIPDGWDKVYFGEIYETCCVSLDNVGLLPKLLGKQSIKYKDSLFGFVSLLEAY